MRRVSSVLLVAGRLRVPTMLEPECLCTGETEALAVCQLSASGFADGRDNLSKHENSAGGLVLGSLPDDYRQARCFGTPAATPTWLARYEIAWMMLHKFRRAMVNVALGRLRAIPNLHKKLLSGGQNSFYVSDYRSSCTSAADSPYDSASSLAEVFPNTEF